MKDIDWDKVYVHAKKSYLETFPDATDAKAEAEAELCMAAAKQMLSAPIVPWCMDKPTTDRMADRMAEELAKENKNYFKTELIGKWE